MSRYTFRDLLLQVVPAVLVIVVAAGVLAWRKQQLFTQPKQPMPLSDLAAEVETGFENDQTHTTNFQQKEDAMADHGTATALHVSESDFEEKVLNSPVPVLVDFYADWCPPCRMMSPVVDQVATELEGARVVKVNVDQCPNLAEKYSIRSIPTFMVFRDGKPVAKHVGTTSKDGLKSLLE